MKEIRSKYQQKNYEEITFDFDEYTCYKCSNIFMVDIDKCKIEFVSDQARPYTIFYCPYCRAKNRIMI